MLKTRQTIEEAGISIIQNGDIYDWMQKADLMLATYSSTSLEAISFGLPIIILSSSRTPDRSPFFSKDSHVLKAESADQLKSYVVHFTQNPSAVEEYLRFLQHDFQISFNISDNSSSNRAVEAIEKFIPDNIKNI